MPRKRASPAFSSAGGLGTGTVVVSMATDIIVVASPWQVYILKNGVTFSMGGRNTNGFWMCESPASGEMILPRPGRPERLYISSFSGAGSRLGDSSCGQKEIYCNPERVKSRTTYSKCTLHDSRPLDEGVQTRPGVGERGGLVTRGLACVGPLRDSNNPHDAGKFTQIERSVYFPQGKKRKIRKTLIGRHGHITQS